LLEGTGIAVDCVENGKDALDKMATDGDKYDIVLMDMQMPTMDGLEATRRIRTLPAVWCKQIPIIAMTANVFKADVERCIAAGMNDHIGKPIDLNIVHAKLRSYLQG
jgi:CheY-like chemotaxis protein